jgi:hypothetical protein
MITTGIGSNVSIDELHTRVLGASCYLPLHAFNPTADLCHDAVPFEFISVDNLPPKPPSAWQKLWGTAPAKGAEEKKERVRIRTTYFLHITPSISITSLRTGTALTRDDHHQ